jgi:hypothetical protein
MMAMILTSSIRLAEDHCHVKTFMSSIEVVASCCILQMPSIVLPLAWPMAAFAMPDASVICDWINIKKNHETVDRSRPRSFRLIRA